MPDIENLLNIEDEVTQVLSDLGVNEKLNEMDDFMNQNDLKVQITNENAVVTGLVTYTCTVKDKNNTALANKVVEWYKGTTLIGIDATDSNGVSTFSHRVTEADIYDVHAIVRGTHAGDDIRMFVKDKNNLYSYNIWSGTDLNKSIQYQTEYTTGRDITVTSSNEYSNTGDYSIKLISNENNAWVRFKLQEISQYVGNTLTVSAMIYSPLTTLGVNLTFFDSNNNVIKTASATVNSNTQFTIVSLNDTVTEDTSYVMFYLTPSTSTAIYVDDINGLIL